MRRLHGIGGPHVDSHGWYLTKNIGGLVQDCSNSSALAMELLQSCTEPSTYRLGLVVVGFLELFANGVCCCLNEFMIARFRLTCYCVQCSCDKNRLKWRFLLNKGTSILPSLLVSIGNATTYYSFVLSCLLDFISLPTSGFVSLSRYNYIQF